MGQIKVLDCTLRDGGYCNDCRFGFENQKKITQGLLDAGIDIVECGFLIEDVTYEKDVTRFNSLDQISHIIPQDRDGKIFVALMDYGKYNEELLPDYDGTSIDGLRIAFHKNNYIKALDVCKRIKDKGYKVFVQPMVSVSYTDEEKDEYAAIMADVQTYVEETINKFIVGDLDVDADYPTFVETLKSMGAERALEINQAAVERWQNKGGVEYEFVEKRADVSGYIDQIPFKTEKGLEYLDEDLK